MFIPLLHQALNILFPPTCVGCKTDGSWLCQTCLEATQPLTLKHPTSEIDVLYCLGSYDIPILATAVQRLKYHGGQALAATLGQTVAASFAKSIQADIVVPVPLHPSRERERGFNQSLRIGQALSSEAGLKIVSPVRRIRRTVPQVTLDEAGRQENVRDAFGLVSELEKLPPRAIIVDDVFTTGATISAVARVLRSGGVKHIAAVTVAKG